MENQHRKITGYRELTEGEITVMNKIKEHAEAAGQLCDDLATLASKQDPVVRPDQRWVAIGRTQLQQGFMALTRAVAKPTTF